MIAQTAADETTPVGTGEAAVDPITSIGDLLGDDLGASVVFFGVTLALAILGFTFLALRLLYRSTPQVGLPRPRWGVGEVLFAFAMWLVVQTAFVAASTKLLTLFTGAGGIHWLDLGAWTGNPIELSIRLTALGIGGLAFAGVLLIIPRIVEQPLTVLGIGTGSIAQGFAGAILVGLTIIPAALVVALLWQITLFAFGVEPTPQEVVEEFSRAIGGNGTSLVAAIAFLTVVVAPITEELLFRAVLFRWLQTEMPTWGAVILSGVIFSLCHFSLTAFLPLALLGILFAVILHRTGNLWACIALHALFNGTNLLLMAAAQLL